MTLLSGHFNSILQQTFQVALATNGKESFANLIYASPERVRDIVNSGNGVVGFDAGDEMRSATVLSRNMDSNTFRSSNWFRIDGMLKEAVC